MTVDYIVASLPALVFGEPPAISSAAFAELCAGVRGFDPGAPGGEAWRDIETQLRNAMAAARGGAKYARPARGCSIHWRDRVAACFQEEDVAKRDEMLDRVWWDAAGELTSPSDPLGKGALATYAVRLRIAERRARISPEAGDAAFDALTAATKPQVAASSGLTE